MGIATLELGVRGADDRAGIARREKTLNQGQLTK